MDKIKVLHIFSSYGGGISSLILNLIENKTSEFVFDTLAFSYLNGDEFVSRLNKCGTKCYTMPRPRVDGYKTYYTYLEDLFKREKYDAIHCHIIGWRFRTIQKIAKKCGINTFILHAHTTHNDSKIDAIPIVNRLNHIINYKYSTAYMTCSDMAAEYIYGVKYLKKRNAVLIPNGVKKEIFSESITQNEIDQYIQEFNLSGQEKVILHVGRFNEQKNHKFIVNIIEASVGMGMIFLLVGEGVLTESIKEMIEERGLTEITRFLGRRSDISKLMQFSNCMILPSLYEGLPTVAIESQAAGTPILLADTITKQSDLKIGLAEFLSISDAEMWSNKILKICNKKQELTSAIKQVECRGFTAQAAGEAYCSQLKKIIG